MKALLIVFGVIFCLVAYAVICYKVITIMDDADCKGTFIEWATALLPIVHLVFLIKNWDLLGGDTWDEQYKEMYRKINRMRERNQED